MAATLVAATGALLLLAAAATFLAVSWDTVPIPARVAIVGAATAAAIGGGAALRRRLPAVGAVVFHLGVLLVPVDVLGLCLQLGASRATTWTAVGVATLGALPVAGRLGAAPMLGALGLVGVPVTATGLVDLGAVPLAAPVLVALAGVAVAVAGWPGTNAAARRAAAPLLASTAVVGPVVVSAATAALVWGGGTPLRTATATGWRPERWQDAMLVGLVGVATVAVVAIRGGSRRLAATVPVLGAFAIVGILLAGDAPRLALLLPAPLLLVTLEVVARLLADDRLLARPTSAAAAVAESLAALVLPVSLVAAVTAEVGLDRELAVATTLGAVGWVVAAVRRDRDHALVPLLGAAAVVTAAAAVTHAAPGLPWAGSLLLAGATGTLAFRADGPVGVAASAVGVALGGAALTAIAVLPVPPAAQVGAAVASALALAPAVVAAIGAVVVLLRLDAHLQDDPTGRLAVAALLPVHLVAALMATVEVVGLHGDAWGGSVWVVLLLAGGALLDRAPGVADGLRALAAVVATLVIVSPTSAGDVLTDAAVALPAAALVAVVLAVEVWRTGRDHLALLAGPAAVRALAGGAWLVSGSRVTTGAVLVAAAVVPAALALLAPRWRAAGVVTAATAGVAGVALLAVSAHAAAITLLVVGLATALAGGWTRSPALAHLGGLTATVGAWWLLGLESVTALDLWAAPLAAYLWLALAPARRAGRLSSWTADVPPLLLVVVPAVLERLDGGPGWHAVLAGVLGVVAVVGGGTGRHAGPLLVGAATVLTVVGVETVAVVAVVPTWAWLTLGGVTLLGAAVLIERTGGTPTQSARRLREVLTERFD